MQNENSFFGNLFKPQRVIPRVRLKLNSWKGSRRNKIKERDESPYFGVSYKSNDVEAHLLPFHQKSNNVIVTHHPNKYPQLQTFQRKPANSTLSLNNINHKVLIDCSKNSDLITFENECESSQNNNACNRYFKETPTTNWLVNEEENIIEKTPPRLRKTTDNCSFVVPKVKHSKNTNDRESGVELLLEVNQYIKDIFMWLDYQKKGYVTYNAVKILCHLLNKSYPNFDDACNSVSENDKCIDKFCKQHLRFEKFSFLLRHCLEKEESLITNLSQRQNSIIVSGVPRRLELLKNIISSINKLDSYRKFWNLSEESSARNGLHFDAFKNSNISIISREVELKRRILFQQQEINGLREIIEGLRIALQSSDAENLCLHVRLQLDRSSFHDMQPFNARRVNHEDREMKTEMKKSYSCESLESGFQTSFESVSKLKSDNEMSNEYSADSDYQNLSKDDDIDYLRRKLRKAYSKIHKVNRELESLKFLTTDNKTDKERMHELQNQIDGLKVQMYQKDILLNDAKKECSSLRFSRSRIVSELLNVRDFISELCLKVKKQEGKVNKHETTDSLLPLNYDSSTDSLDRYSETCLDKLGCSSLEWDNYKEVSSDSTSDLNLSSISEDEGEYLINLQHEPRLPPKPPRKRNKSIKFEGNNVKKHPVTFNKVKDFRNEPINSYNGGISYYKSTGKIESKRILDNLEEEMKILQYNLDNGKW